MKEKLDFAIDFQLYYIKAIHLSSSKCQHVYLRFVSLRFQGLTENRNRQTIPRENKNSEYCSVCVSSPIVLICISEGNTFVIF